MAILYDLHNVSKTRQTGETAFELHIAQFRMGRGEFVAIVGPSGCGKSTFLDLLALMLRPDENPLGRFRFTPAKDHQKPVDVTSFWQNHREKEIAAIRRKHIGYILQTGGLLPFLSVGRNIALTCRLNGMGVATAGRVTELARLLGIQDQLTKKPQYLSGGQRQRAAIARAMAHRPSVVLADEPTAAVDRERALAIVAEFRQLAEAGRTGIVMVTHDRGFIQPVADRLFSFTLANSEQRGIAKTTATLVEL